MPTRHKRRETCEHLKGLIATRQSKYQIPPLPATRTARARVEPSTTRAVVTGSTAKCSSDQIRAHVAGPYIVQYHPPSLFLSPAPSRARFPPFVTSFIINGWGSYNSLQKRNRSEHAYRPVRDFPSGCIASGLSSLWDRFDPFLTSLSALRTTHAKIVSSSH